MAEHTARRPRRRTDGGSGTEDGTAGGTAARGVLRRLSRYCLRHRRHTAAAFGAVAVANAMAVLGPLVARAVIDRAPHPGAGLALPVAAFVAVGLVRAAAGYVRRYRANALGIWVQYDLRNDILAAIHRLDGRRRDELESGQVLSRATTDLAMVQGLLYFLPLLLGNVLLFAGALTAMFVLSAPLACLALLVGPALVAITWRSRRAVFPATWTAQRHAAGLVGIAEENVAGVYVVRGFGQEQRELARFDEAARRLLTARVRAARVASRYTAALLTVPALGQIALLALGGWLALRGDLTLGTFLAFAAYLGELVAPVRTVGGAITMVQQTRAALIRLFEIVDATPSVRQRPGATRLDRVRGLVEFEEVTFGHDPRHPVLRGLSLRVEPGQVVAFAGPPGCGKSTAAMLLTRVYDPDRGAVRLDGHDVRDLELASLRARVGIAFDEPFLFRGSVRANLAYGRPDTTDEQVLGVARATEVDRFARSLPGGYDTAVGERGAALSGGQRQLVALARTLLADPAVVVLDDATASVDAATEARVLARLRDLLHGRTVLLMAHRPATLRLADRVVLLDAGRVVDTGTHEELLRRCPAYRRLLATAAHHPPAGRAARPANGSADTTGEPATGGGTAGATPPPTAAGRGDPLVAEVPGTDPSLGRLARPLRYWFALALGLVACDVLAGLALPALVRFGIDRGVAHHAEAVLFGTAAVALAVALLGGLANAAAAQVTARTAERLLHTLRVRIFAHLQRITLDYHGREGSGRILTRLTTDVDALSSFLQTGAVNLVAGTLLFAGVCVALVSYNAGLAAVALGALPVLLVSAAVFRRRSTEAYARMREKAGAVNAELQENLDGLRVTQALGQQRRVAEAFGRANDEHRGARLRAFRMLAGYFGFVEAVAQLGTAAVLGVGAGQVAAGTLTVGELIAFYLYLGLFFSPVQQLSQAAEVAQQAAVGWRRIADLLRVAPATAPVSAPVPVRRLRGDVELRDVRFCYPGAGRPALDGVSLRLFPGETVALVGATGAGKSTLVTLLARLHDVTGGSIRVDGVDIRRYDPTQLRRRLGFVPQEPFLFDGSVRDNVAYGRPDATAEEIDRALRAVGADQVLARLPHGLSTQVGLRGLALSAGQRQLVALARAQLVDPDVLLLDEVTASLDPATEAAYLRATQEMSRARLTVVVAHRLTTAARAHRVVVLGHGRVVESGPHRALLLAGGAYARLWAAAHGGGAARADRDAGRGDTP